LWLCWLDVPGCVCLTLTLDSTSSHHILVKTAGAQDTSPTRIGALSRSVSGIELAEWCPCRPQQKPNELILLIPNLILSKPTVPLWEPPACKGGPEMIHTAIQQWAYPWVPLSQWERIGCEKICNRYSPLRLPEFTHHLPCYIKQSEKAIALCGGHQMLVWETIDLRSTKDYSMVDYLSIVWLLSGKKDSTISHGLYSSLGHFSNRCFPDPQLSLEHHRQWETHYLSR
jgi:hypothetical protein